MNLVASVSYNKSLKVIMSNKYKTKSAFYNHLREMGYRIRFISNENNFESEAIIYNEMCKANLQNKKQKRIEEKMKKIEENCVQN